MFIQMHGNGVSDGLGKQGRNGFADHIKSNTEIFRPLFPIVRRTPKIGPGAKL